MSEPDGNQSIATWARWVIGIFATFVLAALLHAGVLIYRIASVETTQQHMQGDLKEIKTSVEKLAKADEVSAQLALLRAEVVADRSTKRETDVRQWDRLNELTDRVNEITDRFHDTP